MDDLSILGGMIEPAISLPDLEVIPTSIGPVNDIVFGCGGLPRGRVIEILAEESQGKCVNKRTPIYTKFGIKEIGDFDSKDYKDDSFNDLKIEVLDNNHFVETDKVYVKNDVPTIRLKTQFGYELEGTPHHRIKILDTNGNIIWKRLDELIDGDWATILTPTNINIINNPPDIDRKVARLLGYLVAEGHISISRGFGFTTSTKLMLDDYLNCLDEVLPKHKASVLERKRKEHYKLTYYVRSSSRARDENKQIDRRKLLFNQYGLDYWDSGNKEIPKWVLENTQDVWVEFLNGYLAGDGGVSYTDVYNRKHRSIITACSKSEKLIEQLHFMLLMLGVISRKYIKKHKLPNKEEYRDYYNLKISGRHAIRLAGMLNLRHPEKNECLNKSSNIEGTDLNDIIHCPKLLKDIKEWVMNQYSDGSYRNKKDLHYMRDINAKKLNYMINGTHRITRFEIKKLINLLESKFPECPYIEQLEYISNDCRFYDKITNLEDSKSDVMDFHIPSTHSFIGNGFINHNSTIAQWFCTEAQKQGGLIAWADAEKTFSKDYATSSGLDINTLQMIKFSFGEDLLYKIKLMIAMNVFDIIVIDSVNSVIPESLSESKIESFSMNERLQSAKMWADFFRVLEGGYEIKDLNSKPVKSNVITKIIDEKKLIEIEKDTIHSISQKKTCLILINHKNAKVGVTFGQKFYTPGGKKKDFAFSVRLDVTRKKTQTGQEKGIKTLKYRIIELRAVKNKVGVPLGTAQVKMEKSGQILPLTDEDINVLKDVELEDEIEKLPDTANNGLAFLADKLEGNDNG